VLLNGEIVNERRPYERNVSTVFQSYALFPHLTARQNVEFGLRRHGASDIDRKVREILALVDLTGKESRRPAQLSGGERQRVALARSLVLEPDVLLLDEPLAALDPKLRKQMRVELKAMQRRTGITFLLVTHDQVEALSMSDQLAVVNKGKIEQVGSPEDVYLRPSTRFVAGFLGAVNWIGGVGIRPEATRITRAQETCSGPHAAGVVASSVFLGDCVEVFTRLDSGEEVVAQVPRGAAAFRVGDAVRINWDAAEEMRFP
jgi:ABC-type Fe3+/spermidine/putrescine transport system ATPase subunit